MSTCKKPGAFPLEKKKREKPVMLLEKGGPLKIIGIQGGTVVAK